MAGTRGTTAKERSDLERLTRDRERVAKTQARYREAALKADVEEQLSAQFAADDARWQDVVRQAVEVIRQAQTSVNDQIAAICTEAGIPKEFHPSLFIGTRWLKRGENADKERRNELRSAAYARIEALRLEAEHAIEAASVDMRSRILSTGLASDEARELLAAMPQPDELMPKIDLTALDRSVPLSPGTRTVNDVPYWQKDDHEH